MFLVFSFFFCNVVVVSVVSAFSTFSFIHLSDVHLDLMSSPSTYGMLTLCRQLKGADPLSPFVPDAPFGRRNCDTTPVLFEAALNQMKQQQPSSTLDFIMNTGDLCAHNQPSAKSALAAVRNVTQTITSADWFSGVPLFSVVGNNDVYPDYQVTCNDPQLADLAEAMGIDVEANPQFLVSGSHSLQVNNNRTVLLGLNTVIYSKNNKLVDQQDSDPCGQFAWLEQQLVQAEQAGQKVYISGHIPPLVGAFVGPANPPKGNGKNSQAAHHLRLADDDGWRDGTQLAAEAAGFASTQGAVVGKKHKHHGKNNSNPNYVAQFLSVTSSFVSSGVLAGTFWGHRHSDEFFVLGRQPNSVFGLLAPALTPITYNPGFRVVHASIGDSSVQDYDQFVLDLGQANAASRATWFREYSFQSAYGTAPSLTGLSSLQSSLAVNASLWQLYNARLTTSFQVLRWQQICLQMAVTADDIEMCNSKH